MCPRNNWIKTQKEVVPRSFFVLFLLLTCVHMLVMCVFCFCKAHLPFAVVGSDEEVKIGNKMVKARQYPWGTVQGEA